MAKSDFHPKKGVVYECYRSFTDVDGDRARRGQKFVLGTDFGDGEVFMEKASGRGRDILVKKEDFAKYFCPAATSEKKDAAPQAAEAPSNVEAHVIGCTWEDVKEHINELPKFIQELLKRAKPELFEPPKPKVFEFKGEGNKFGTNIIGFDKNVPFIVGKGLVNDEDKMKCLVVDSGVKAELFTGPRGHQCIRFVNRFVKE